MSIRRVWLVWVAVCLLLTTACGSSETTIEGTITAHSRQDSAEKRPLSGGSVELLPVSPEGSATQVASKKTTTDNDGKFVLSDIPPGEYQLTVGAASPFACAGFQSENGWLIIGAQGTDKDGKNAYIISAQTKLQITAGQRVQAVLDVPC